MSKPRSLRKSYRTKLEEGFPDSMKLVIGDEEIEYTKFMSLRYGENPHQKAAVYVEQAVGRTQTGMTGVKLMSGPELSFNNFLYNGFRFVTLLGL